MRQKVLVGNWKMNKTTGETRQFAKASLAFLQKARQHNVLLGVAPSFISLATLKKSNPGLTVFAQNVYFEDKGAFTGEISIPMLNDVKADGALVGHSERRAYFKEDNILCNKKVKKLLESGLIALYCVGETLGEYEAGQTKAIVGEQIRVGLSGLPSFKPEQLIVAYEPVWSIGTGKNASKEIAADVIGYIRDLLAEMFGETTAEAIHILYGGSVKPNNVKEYLLAPNIDGALVGGASLEIASFEALLDNII
ncbi:MAG TPA: triose-phosphate isomerase [Bacilli bacterium]|nr:triose-phosphate isomerase [Bacilli bacterium]